MKTNIIISLALSTLFTTHINAQPQNQLKPNWYNLDLKSDGVFGISINKAYQELLKNKNSTKVTVAVIDGGLDITHEDLKNVIWKNLKEISGNGKDDDKNGYIDDVNGWNFLGSAKESYEYDNDEIVRDIRKYNKKFSQMDSAVIDQKELPDYRLYQSKKNELKSKLDKINAEIYSSTVFLKDVDAIQKKIGKDSLNANDFKNFIPSNEAEVRAQNFMVQVLKRNSDYRSFMAETRARLEDNQIRLNYRLNLNYDPRAKYASEYALARGKFYGNNNVYGPVPPAHGTHSAGIIGAERNNNIGIDGVANNVAIMPIRAIPVGNGLERDQANAILYAADNGAKVINLSFIFSISSDHKELRAAINYALSKDIIFIQAAGNAHEDLDLISVFPNVNDAKDQSINNAFIKVGASGYINNKDLVVPFSNYGKQNVDVFAPGLDIYSTIPGNKYENHSGTSMAGPVVAGLAAVIRAYYPKLTAQQVKRIIVGSVIKTDFLTEKCSSEGVVNAYRAIELADSYH